MEYKVNHTINCNTIHIQVIHNKNYYPNLNQKIFDFLVYETNISNNDTNQNILKYNNFTYHHVGNKLIICNNDTTFQLDKMECNYYDFMEMKKELEQVKNICLRHNIFNLEQQIHINEDQQPIIFHRMYNHIDDIFDATRDGSRAAHFYKKSELIIVNSAHTHNIEKYLAKHKYKIGPLRCSSIIINNIIQVIIPVRKIMKVWINNKAQPTYYTRGIYEILLKDIDMIWLGSEECKDDIPDNSIELAIK